MSHCMWPDQGWIKYFFLRGFPFHTMQAADQALERWPAWKKNGFAIVKLDCIACIFFYCSEQSMGTICILFSALRTRIKIYVKRTQKILPRRDPLRFWNYWIRHWNKDILWYIYGISLWIRLRGWWSGNYFKSLYDSTRHNAILTEGGFCSINQHFKNKA